MKIEKYVPEPQTCQVSWDEEKFALKIEFLEGTTVRIRRWYPQGKTTYKTGQTVDIIESIGLDVANWVANSMGCQGVEGTISEEFWGDV